MSYKVVELRKKLKTDFQKLNKEELKQIAQTKGSDFLTTTKRVELLGYSGDTPVKDY